MAQVRRVRPSKARGYLLFSLIRFLAKVRILHPLFSCSLLPNAKSSAAGPHHPRLLTGPPSREAPLSPRPLQCVVRLRSLDF